MKRLVVVPAMGAVVVALLWSSLIARAAEQPYPAGTLLTVAGNGKDGFAKDGTPATQVALGGPQDQALDAAGNLYIAEGDNHRIRKVGPDGILTEGPRYGDAGSEDDGNCLIRKVIGMATPGPAAPGG